MKNKQGNRFYHLSMRINLWLELFWAYASKRFCLCPCAIPYFVFHLVVLWRLWVTILATQSNQKGMQNLIAMFKIAAYALQSLTH